MNIEYASECNLSPSEQRISEETRPKVFPFVFEQDVLMLRSPGTSAPLEGMGESDEESSLLEADVLQIQILHADPYAAIKQLCIGKIVLRSSKNILITSDELALLRYCAEIIKDKPNKALKIVAEGCGGRIAFITKTLIHLGVSCGQISTR